jgi:hypothetical protein
MAHSSIEMTAKRGMIRMCTQTPEKGALPDMVYFPKHTVNNDVCPDIHDVTRDVCVS